MFKRRTDADEGSFSLLGDLISSGQQEAALKHRQAHTVPSKNK